MLSDSAVLWLIHSTTLVAPIAYVLAAVSYFNMLHIKTSMLWRSVEIHREERPFTENGQQPILLNVLWPGLGFHRLGDQVLAFLLSTFHLFFFAQLLLERANWKVIPVVMIFVNLVFALGRLFKVLDDAKVSGVLTVLRFSRSA